MQGTGGSRSRLISLGCYILFLLVVRLTRGAEANQQNRDCREQTQQEDKLQKVNNLHFDPLHRCLDNQRANDNEEQYSITIQGVGLDFRRDLSLQG